MHETLKPQLRQHRLRALEAVAITTTAAAFALTALLVSTGSAIESNPAAAGLFDAMGWAATGVLAVGVEAACFAVLRRHRERESVRGWALERKSAGDQRDVDILEAVIAELTN